VKYNFFDQLEKLKADPNHQLPADINKPMIEWLEKIGCGLGADLIADAQVKVRYEGIELVHDDNPNAKIAVQIDAGMVGERREYEIKRKGKWTAFVYRTIKNPNLNKQRPREKK